VLEESSISPEAQAEFPLPFDPAQASRRVRRVQLLRYGAAQPALFE